MLNFLFWQWHVVLPNAAARAAAAAVNTLGLGDVFSVLAGSLVWMDLTFSTCSNTPAGAQHWGQGYSFSVASLRLFFILFRSLVHDDELVLLPVAGLGVCWVVRGPFEAHGCISAAAGLGRWVGLTVRSEWALGATNHTFAKARRQPQATGLWVLNVFFLHWRSRPVIAHVVSCCLDDIGGATGVWWHRVRDHGGGFTVSHAGVGYLRALCYGQRATSGKAGNLMGVFKLPIMALDVTIDMIGARRVDAPENIGNGAPALLERGDGWCVVVSKVWLFLIDRPRSRDLLRQM